jgi:hypothetical protein
MGSDKIEAEYTAIIRKIEAETLAAKQRLASDLLALKIKAENPAQTL